MLHSYKLLLAISLFVLIQTATSSFYGFGKNIYGQIGTSRMELVSTFPGKVEYIGPSITHVAACTRHTLLLNSNGIVLSFGYNGDGRLGIGSTQDQKKPTVINYLGLPIIKVSCWDHSLFLDNNGTVFASGSNAFGKMAIGNSGSSNKLKQTLLTEKIVEFAAGQSHSLFLTNYGVVYSVGSNSAGQLGNPPTVFAINPVLVQYNQTITKVAAGETHSILLSITGKVIVFGGNSQGQLGDGSTSSKTTPFELPINENIHMISAGKVHTLLLTNQSEVYSFGGNSDGNLCDGTTTQKLFPVKIQSNESFISISASDFISVLLTSDNEVLTCGKNDNGQLGDLSSTNKYTPTKIYNIGKKYKQISSAKEHSVVLSTDGVSYSFGGNQYGQLGITSLDPKIPNLSEISDAIKIKRISAGNQFSAVLSSNKTSYTFGLNSFGNLGVIDSDSKVFPTQINYNASEVDDISAGFQHLLILSKGTVQGVGYNMNGELGVGTSFLKTSSFNDINYLGPQIVRISAGAFYSMILTSNGEVHTFGKNDVGQLGDGTNVNRFSPIMIQYNSTLNSTMNGTLVTQISCGNSHSMILTYEGKVYTFGLNSFGQLGIGNYVNQNLPNLISNRTEIFVQISAGGFHSLILSKTGVVFAFGKNHKGQLGIGSTISTPIALSIRNETFNQSISKISAGDSHSMILDDQGDVFTFGSNVNGELGIGNKVDKSIATLIQFPRNRIVDISAGFDHSLILEENIWTNNPLPSPSFSPVSSSVFTPLISPKKSPSNSPTFSPKFSYGVPKTSSAQQPSNSPKKSPTTSPIKSTGTTTPQTSKKTSNSSRNHITMLILLLSFIFSIL